MPSTPENVQPVPSTPNGQAAPLDDSLPATPAALTANEEIPAESLVQRMVREIMDLRSAMFDRKEDIKARGIPARTLDNLIDLGVRDNLTAQTKLKRTALLTASQQHGATAISADELDAHLLSLVDGTRELNEARRVARVEGLEMTALNFLTDVMQRNPGDRGELVINTLVAYAMTCGVSVVEAVRLAEEFQQHRTSVLPDLKREDFVEQHAPLRQWLSDIAIGLVLGVGALALLT